MHPAQTSIHAIHLYRSELIMFCGGLCIGLALAGCACVGWVTVAAADRVQVQR